MAQFGTTVAWNFRDLLADIADTGPDDIISWEVDGDRITGLFRLDDGFTASLLRVRIGLIWGSRTLRSEPIGWRSTLRAMMSPPGAT